MLVNLFWFTPQNALGQTPPTPTSTHNLTAADGGATIADIFNANGYEGTMTLKYADWIDSESITGGPTGSSGPTDPLVYSFDGLTTEDHPYYFIISTSDMTGFGLVKYNKNNQKYESIKCTDRDNSELINSFSDLKTPLTDRQKQYLSSFFYSSTLGPSKANYSLINNMTLNKISRTSSSVNCPEYQIGNVNYAPEVSGYKFSEEDQQRVNEGKPAKSTKLRLWYKPAGAPVYLAYPVLPPNVDAMSSTAVIDIDNDKNTANLQISNLKPGTYAITSLFGIENIENSEIKSLDPDITNTESFSSFITRINNGQFKSTLNSAAALIGGPLVAAKILSRGAARANWEAYSGSTTFTVAADGTINPALESGCPKSFEYSRDTSQDTSVGNKKSVCTATNGDTSIVAMIEEGLCGITVTLKKWADGFFNWAKSWMNASIGLVQNQTTNTPDDFPTVNTESGEQTGDGAPTSSTTPASTTPAATGTTTTGKVLTESLLGTGPTMTDAAVNQCKKDKQNKIYTDADLAQQPCLTKQFSWMISSTGSVNQTDYGIQIVKGGKSTFDSNKQQPNYCGKPKLIILNIDCSASGKTQ